MLVGNHAEQQRRRSASFSEVGVGTYSTADCCPMRKRCSSFSQTAAHTTADCSQLAALQCACNNMKNAPGPCQLWAVVHHMGADEAALQQPELPLTLAFVSTSFNQWLNYAFRCEDKVLCGVLGCVAQDDVKLLKVIRFGANVKDEVRHQMLGTGLLDRLISHPHGEILMLPEDEPSDLRNKISEVLQCDPCAIRL